MAEGEGAFAVAIEAPENRSLPGIPAPALPRLDRLKGAGDRAERAPAVFAPLELRCNDLEVAVGLDPEPGLADSGDLAHLTVAVGARDGGGSRARRAARYGPEEPLAAPISASRRASRRRPSMPSGAAALAQLPGPRGRAKCHAERPLELVPIGPLDAEAAATAIRVPEAVRGIVRKGEGKPDFLQEWGEHARDAADASPIEAADIETAAVAERDAGFFPGLMHESLSLCSDAQPSTRWTRS